MYVLRVKVTGKLTYDDDVLLYVRTTDARIRIMFML